MKLLTQGSYKPNMVCADWLLPTIDTKRLRETLDMVKPMLVDLDFDAVAYTGNSGALIAIPLALEMGKSLILVRKTTEGCHSGLKVEGDINARTYIIADDFICSGETVRRIIREVREFNPTASCVGIIEAQRIADSRKFYITEAKTYVRDVDYDRIRERNNQRFKVTFKSKTARQEEADAKYARRKEQKEQIERFEKLMAENTRRMLDRPSSFFDVPFKSMFRPRPTEQNRVAKDKYGDRVSYLTFDQKRVEERVFAAEYAPKFEGRMTMNEYDTTLACELFDKSPPCELVARKERE